LATTPIIRPGSTLCNHVRYFHGLGSLFGIQPTRIRGTYLDIGMRVLSLLAKRLESPSSSNCHSRSGMRTVIFILSAWLVLEASAAVQPAVSGEQNYRRSAPTDSTDPNRQLRQDFKDLPVRIRLDVPVMRQPSSTSSWATVYAMMKSWKAGKLVSIEAAIAELGAPYTTYLAEDLGLPGGQELEFVKASGLRAKPPASYTLTTFRDLLRSSGPVWIITGDGITAHARLLVGIYGTEETEKIAAYEGTTMEFIDPALGINVYEPALKFFDMFERETAFIVNNRFDALDLRWQVISY
jgi:Papain-like cysteine protease AvrRpt2